MGINTLIPPQKHCDKATRNTVTETSTLKLLIHITIIN